MECGRILIATPQGSIHIAQAWSDYSSPYMIIVIAILILVVIVVVVVVVIVVFIGGTVHWGPIAYWLPPLLLSMLCLLLLL